MAQGFPALPPHSPSPAHTQPFHQPAAYTPSPYPAPPAFDEFLPPPKKAVDQGEDELTLVMNVLLETGMDPQQIDPAAVYQALCRTKGDMDAALVRAHIPPTNPLQSARFRSMHPLTPLPLPKNLHTPVACIVSVSCSIHELSLPSGNVW